MQAQALIDFGRKLGIESSAFKETGTECNLIQNLRAGSLKKLRDQDIEDLIAAFGESLTMWIGLASGPRSLEIERGQIRGSLATALKRIAHSEDSLELHIDLRIDKASILKQYDLVGIACHTLFYIFAGNLIQTLKSTLPRLDSELFVSEYMPTVIFVSDAEVHHVGHLLTIVGPTNVEQIRAEASRLSASVRSRIDRYRTSARAQLSWQGFQFKHLTPLHFLCEGLGQDNTELDSILADHTLHLGILYTANRSAYNGAGFDATYAGSEEIAELSLLSGVPIPAPENLLPRLALWPHGGGERGTNRLTFFQNAVARELEGDSPPDNYRIFVQRLRSLLGEARWHHRVYVDGEIAKHFEQVERVTDYVADVTKEVSQAIDALTKGLTEALLGAVGVVVLTMLATLLKGDVQEFIIQLALWVYAAYLLLIQGAYRMGSIAHSYSLLLGETDKRLAAYRDQLGRDRVETVASPLDRRKQQFWRWFGVTAAIYLVLIVLLCWLSFSLSGFLASAESASPTAMPPPTPTP